MRVTMKEQLATPEFSAAAGQTVDLDKVLAKQLIDGRHAVATDNDPSEEGGPATKRRTATRTQPSRRGGDGDAGSPRQPDAEPDPQPGDADAVLDLLRAAGADDAELEAFEGELDDIAGHDALLAALASCDDDRRAEFVELWRDVMPHLGDSELVASVVAGFADAPRDGDDDVVAPAKAPRARKR